MLSPDLVILVIPPTVTIKATAPAVPNSHAATGLLLLPPGWAASRPAARATLLMVVLSPAFCVAAPALVSDAWRLAIAYPPKRLRAVAPEAAAAGCLLFERVARAAELQLLLLLLRPHCCAGNINLRLASAAPFLPEGNRAARSVQEVPARRMVIMELIYVLCPAFGVTGVFGEYDIIRLRRTVRMGSLWRFGRMLVCCSRQKSIHRAASQTHH